MTSETETVEPAVEGLDSETKDYFDSRGGEAKETPPPKEPEAPQDAEPKQPAKKDPPEVERENLKRAMHEERELRKQERAERERLQAQVTKQEERLARFLELANKAPEPPRFEEDPAGNLKAQIEALQSQLSQVQQNAGAVNARQQAEERDRALVTAITTREAAFSREHADYPDAAEHVVSLQRSQLEAMGVPEAEIPLRVNFWAKAVASQAMQLGRDPAQVFYDMAQKSGFKPKGAAQAEQAKESLEKIAKGQEAAKGLGGGRGPEGLSLAKIAEMDDDALQDLVSKGWNKVAKLMR